MAQHSTVSWLTYQDAAGNVIYGGTPMGPVPQSEPFAAATLGANGTPDTSTQGLDRLAIPFAMVAIGALSLAVRRRRRAG